jgi:hypothetical protein
MTLENSGSRVRGESQIHNRGRKDVKGDHLIEIVMRSEHEREQQERSGKSASASLPITW